VFEANIENAVILDEEWAQLKLEQTEATDALNQSIKHSIMPLSKCVRRGLTVLAGQSVEGEQSQALIEKQADHDERMRELDELKQTKGRYMAPVFIPWRIMYISSTTPGRRAPKPEPGVLPRVSAARPEPFPEPDVPRVRRRRA
jgi:hypothetical protein